MACVMCGLQAVGIASVHSCAPATVGDVADDSRGRVSENGRWVLGTDVCIKNLGRALSVPVENLESLEEMIESLFQLAAIVLKEVTSSLSLCPVYLQDLVISSYLQKDRTTCNNVLCREQ